MKKEIAYTVKTRTGRIFPSWIFETKEEAQEFCDELNEKCHPQRNIVAKVEISLL